MSDEQQDRTRGPEAAPADEPSEGLAGQAATGQGEDGGEDEHPGYGPAFMKGCGCITASVILAVAVALVGKGEFASWGSGIIGVLFLILVVGTSGTNGWWTK
ncbi:MAG: hypothetical protein PVI30_01960 [Myxococcales bacterium]